MNKISLYTSAFLLKTGNFDYASALDNFTRFADETVICVNDFKDGSLELIKEWQLNNPNRCLKVIVSEFKREWPLFDGAVKNKALQACSNEWCVSCDLDEKINIDLKPRFINAFKLLSQSGHKAFLVPNIEPYMDINNIRFDSAKNFQTKWHIHLKSGVKRGPIKQALLANNFINNEISDGCEATDFEGNLISAPTLIPTEIIKRGNLDEYTNYLKAGGIWVWHFGHSDIQRRIKLNKEFWRQQWIFESNKEKDILLNEAQAFYPTYPHNLPFDL